MTYGQLEDRFHAAPKIGALAETLGVRHAEAAGLWANLFTWALIHAIDGDVTRFPGSVLERAAMWEGTPGAFSEAIASDPHRFIDETKGRRVLHDWWDFAEGIKKAKAAKKRRDADLRKQSRSPRVAHASPTRSPRVAPIRTDLIRTDQSGAEQSRAALPLFASDAPSAPPPAPPVMVFPAQGKEPTWALTESHLASLQKDYFGIDVRRFLEHMRSKAERRALDKIPTAKGYPRALDNWCAIEVRGKGSMFHRSDGPRPPQFGARPRGKNEDVIDDWIRKQEQNDEGQEGIREETRATGGDAAKPTADRRGA